ncbi:MAG: hypothetical protein ACXAEU_25325 [Candidatus Hodarchaeales archaeon]|jgi:hypothetical protein
MARLSRKAQRKELSISLSLAGVVLRMSVELGCFFFGTTECQRLKQLERDRSYMLEQLDHWQQLINHLEVLFTDGATEKRIYQFIFENNTIKQRVITSGVFLTTFQDRFTITAGLKQLIKGEMAQLRNEITANRATSERLQRSLQNRGARR